MPTPDPETLNLARKYALWQLDAKSKLQAIKNLEEELRLLAELEELNQALTRQDPANLQAEVERLRAELKRRQAEQSDPNAKFSASRRPLDEAAPSDAELASVQQKLTECQDAQAELDQINRKLLNLQDDESIAEWYKLTDRLKLAEGKYQVEKAQCEAINAKS